MSATSTPQVAVTTSQTENSLLPTTVEKTGSNVSTKVSTSNVKEELAARPSSTSSFKSSSTKVGHEEGVMPDVSTKDNPAADWRNMRRIIAEDPEWSLATVPNLTELNIRHIISNFAHNSKILLELLPKNQKAVLERIPTDLPLQVTALLVEDEGYWQRCCKARWELCDVAAYGGGWKRMYFERNLEEIVEHFVPETTDPAVLNETLQLSQQFVRRINIRQLLPPVKEEPKEQELDNEDGSDAGSETGDEPDSDHFNFGPVLQALPHVEELHLTYGVRDCGMNFEWNLFQFTARDCLQLAQCVAACKTLRVFRLYRSKVDDDRVRVLISHILDHPSLVDLDLSNNLIGDRGARAVGKFLNNHSQLVRLSLCDNQIRAAGAQAIAHALTKNTTLTYLNLRLNRLGDEGGQAICRALMKNATLVELNLSSNDLAEPTAAILSQVVSTNSTVRTIDLSCNRLGPDGGKQLQEGMEENSTITHMDLRLTECGQESEYCINQVLHRNQEAARDAALREKEANAQPQRKTADPQAAHRYKLPVPADTVSLMA